MEIKHVTVIGAGIMGNQIAMTCATSGYEVVCYDISETMIKKALDFESNWISKNLAGGKISDKNAEAIRKHLKYTTDIKIAGKDADIVLEAVSDILDIKKTVLKDIDSITPDKCIYGSNSSYIVSSKFCDAVKNPSKVMNVHFFNPALVMNTVEVVKGTHTSPETFDAVCSFINTLGKTPCKVEKEIYGFIVNRIFSALTREACYLVDMGIAEPESIDLAIKGALGHPMGPFETLDMTGIDLEYQVYMEKFKESGDKKDLPATCITEHYARNEYGRKNGKGFYEYGK